MSAESVSRRPRQYSVYVVELRPSAASGRPGPCVYVGETALTPEDRFARHKEGGRTASAIVHRHGVRLRPDLAEDVGPFEARALAEAAEARLAELLRKRGFTVFGGQGRTFGLRAEAV